MSSSPLLNEYAEALRAQIRQSQTEHDREAAHAAQCKAQAWRERLTPLEARLAKILSDIPEDIKAEGLSLHTVQTLVKGRWRGNAHPGEVGASLRRLGWQRTRRWRGEGTGFRALWFPPATSTEGER